MSDDEPLLQASQGRTIKLGDVVFEVVDEPGPLPVYADLVTEFRIMNGVVYLTLGSGSVTFDNRTEVRTVARLRMPQNMIPVLASMYQNTTKSMADAAEAAKQSAN